MLDGQQADVIVWPESEQRWHRLIVAHLAKLEVERARMWMSISDTGASDRLQVASDKFAGPSWVAVGDQCRLTLSICISADVYLELYNVSKGPNVPQVLLSANRWVRDLVVWRSFGLDGMINSKSFLEVLDTAFAFDGAVVDDELLKSQMVHSWHKVRAALFLPPLKSSRARKHRPKKKYKRNRKKSGNIAKVVETTDYDRDAWLYNWPMMAAFPFCNLIPPFFPSQDECDDWKADSTDGQHEDDVSAAVLADELSTPDTDFSALFCMPRGNQNQQVSRSNFSDGASQDETGDRISVPATEDSLMFPHYQQVLRSGGVGRVLMKQPSKRGSQPPGLESIADEDGAGCEVSSEDMELPSQVCQDCNCADSSGWSTRWGDYWCLSCWDKWNQEEHSKEADEADEGAESAKPMSMLQRYNMMEPVYCDQRFQTEVRVTSMCCLTAARISNRSTCIVALHPEITIHRRNHSTCWPFSALWKGTSLGDAFEAEVVPPWGGIYWPEIVVCQDEFGEAASPVCVPLVLGSPPWKPENTVESVMNFREEMRTKISNLLRICQIHGHEELVISATFRGLPAREIASLFHELLQTSGDTVGAFRRVIFALPQEEVPAKTLLSFREEFRYTEHCDEPCTSWREGRYLVPGNLPDHCLHAPIRDVKLPEINGVRLGALFRLVSTSCEHQLWAHLPCGRIVLAVAPQLCISAACASDGAAVHLWQKLKDDANNVHLQTWRMTGDGRIMLASRPSLHLRLTQNTHAQLCTEEADATLWSWMPKEGLESPA